MYFFRIYWLKKYAYYNDLNYSPNRLTCEGFLLFWKGCMLGPHDFTFASGLVATCHPLDFQLSLTTFWILWAFFAQCGFAFASHLSPTCLPVSSKCFEWGFTLVFHLSPICFLPLWALAGPQPAMPVSGGYKKQITNYATTTTNHLQQTTTFNLYWLKPQMPWDQVDLQTNCLGSTLV